MKAATTGLVCLLGIGAWSTHAWATIDVLDHESFETRISIRNNTDQDVNFVRMASNCVLDYPPSFIAKANTLTVIVVTQKYWDTGVDDCYAAHHNIMYVDWANAGNWFRIITYDSTREWGCLDIKYNAVFWIHQSVCAESVGNIYGPTDPGICPPGTPDCPPSDDPTPEQLFGFVIVKIQDFKVTLVNQSQRPVDCVMADLNSKADQNSCIYTTSTVGSGANEIVLRSFCPNKTYRPELRGNVQLACYLSGTAFQKNMIWRPVWNGATYVYSANAAGLKDM